MNIAQIETTTIITLLWYIAALSCFMGWVKNGYAKNVGQTIEHNMTDEDMVAVVIGFLATSLTIAWVGNLGLDDGADPLLNNYILMAIVKTAFCIALLLFAKKRFKTKFIGLGLELKKIPPASILSVKYLFVVLALVNIVLYTTQAIAQYFGIEMPIHQALTKLNQAELNIKLMMIFNIAIITPIYEELLFRGILQNYLIANVRRVRQILHFHNKTMGSFTEKPVMDSWVGIILASLAFAMVHADILHWPALIILSIGFGYAYQKNRNLWAAIIMHALFNGSVLALNLLQ